MGEQPRQPNGEYATTGPKTPTATPAATSRATSRKTISDDDFREGNELPDDTPVTPQLRDAYNPARFPHKETADSRQRCKECASPTRGRCARCGQPLCGDCGRYAVDTEGNERHICNTCRTNTIRTETNGNERNGHHYDDYSDDQLRTILGQEEAMGAKYDDMRTELCQRKNGPDVESTPRDLLVKDLTQPDAGGTWNPFTGLSPSKGFCYSPYPERSRVVETKTEWEINDILDSYAEENENLLRQPNHYAGLWRSPVDGKLYLDVSVTSMDASDARQGCENHDQQSFFDLQTFTSVTVNPEAKSGQE